ncbi:MAG TPA: hypothetical protein VMW11_07450 [Candidatus Dormibacteraeota bacterium]|nr:hypothetical protein [Candidatus Dormibacteraeota bacterium]
MGAVLSLGVLLALAGTVLLLNLFGAGGYVVRRVTSRSLGELAPGYAATPRGFKTYAVLVLSVGMLCAGIGLTAVFIPLGAGVIVLAAVTFGVASMIAIAGEVETYRALKR